MGFGGGGSGGLTNHVHNSVPLQGGPLDFANDTIASLNAGSTTFSDGAALQELVIGNPAEVLQVNGGGNAPEWDGRVESQASEILSRNGERGSVRRSSPSIFAVVEFFVVPIRASAGHGFAAVALVIADAFDRLRTGGVRHGDSLKVDSCGRSGRSSRA